MSAAAAAAAPGTGRVRLDLTIIPQFRTQVGGVIQKQRSAFVKFWHKWSEQATLSVMSIRSDVAGDNMTEEMVVHRWLPFSISQRTSLIQRWTNYFRRARPRCPCLCA